MKITLKSLSGEKTPIETEATATVADLKQQLQVALQIDSKQLRLITVGKIMEDAKQIQEYNVKDGDQLVYMVNKPKVIPADSESPLDEEDLAPGESYEAAIQRFIDLGFSQEYATAAMRAANNDPDIALGLLERGEPLEEHLADDEEVEREGNPLAFLLSNEAFLQIRRQLRSNPGLLTDFLTQVQGNNPELYALITEFPNAFQELLDAQDQQVQEEVEPEERLELSEQDQAAVNNLMALGFSAEDALEAYVSCDKNEQMAANFLFENYQS